MLNSTIEAVNRGSLLSGRRLVEGCERRRRAAAMSGDDERRRRAAAASGGGGDERQRHKAAKSRAAGRKCRRNIDSAASLAASCRNMSGGDTQSKNIFFHVYDPMWRRWARDGDSAAIKALADLSGAASTRKDRTDESVRRLCAVERRTSSPVRRETAKKLARAERSPRVFAADSRDKSRAEILWNADGKRQRRRASATRKCRLRSACSRSAASSSSDVRTTQTKRSIASG